MRAEVAGTKYVWRPEVAGTENATGGSQNQKYIGVWRPEVANGVPNEYVCATGVAKIRNEKSDRRSQEPNQKGLPRSPVKPGLQGRQGAPFGAPGGRIWSSIYMGSGVA